MATTLTIPSVILPVSSFYNFKSKSSVSIGPQTGNFNLLFGTRTGFGSDYSLSPAGSDTSTGGNLYIYGGITDTGTMGNVSIKGSKIYEGYTPINTVRQSTVYSGWTTQYTQTNSNWNSVCWSPKLGLFCACARNPITDCGIMVSSDGVNWSTKSTPGTSMDWWAIDWSEQLGLFCAGANTGTSTQRIMVSSGGFVWTLVNQNTTNSKTLRVMTWSKELRLFCTVDASGLLSYYSSNGTIWTAGNSLGKSIRCQAWSPSLGVFCAGAQSYSNASGNAFSISYDAHVWTTGPSAIGRVTSGNMCSIAWSPELQIFCSVPQYNSGTGRTYPNVVVSTGGLLWTEGNINNTNAYWVSVAWSPQQRVFCAVANVRVSASYEPIIKLAVSTGGLYWTHPSFDTMTNWTSICWSPELNIFCSVAGNNIESGGTNHNNKAITSGLIDYNPTMNDIRNTALTNFQTVVPPAITWNNVVWSRELQLYCAVAWSNATTKNIMLSNNGISWTTDIAMPYGNAGFTGLCWSPELGMFVAFGYTGDSNKRIAYSYNGYNWYSANYTSTYAHRGVCWSKELGLFCGVIDVFASVQKIIHSYNGIDWTLSTIPLISSQGLWAIDWSPKLSLFCASGISCLYSSSDGINWISVSFDVGAWYSICWSPELELFCNVRVNGVRYSIDGANWSYQSITSSQWRTICWSPELHIFLIGSNDSTSSILYSTNAINWTLKSKGPDNNINSICWNPDQKVFCAVGDNQGSTSGVYVNLSNNPYNYINRSISMGTSGNLSTTKIKGNTINIGKSSAGIAIGSNASKVQFNGSLYINNQYISNKFRLFNIFQAATGAVILTANSSYWLSTVPVVTFYGNSTCVFKANGSARANGGSGTTEIDCIYNLLAFTNIAPYTITVGTSAFKAYPNFAANRPAFFVWKPPACVVNRWKYIPVGTPGTTGTTTCDLSVSEYCSLTFTEYPYT